MFCCLRIRQPAAGRLMQYITRPHRHTQKIRGRCPSHHTGRCGVDKDTASKHCSSTQTQKRLTSMMDDYLPNSATLRSGNRALNRTLYPKKTRPSCSTAARHNMPDKSSSFSHSAYSSYVSTLRPKHRGRKILNIHIWTLLGWGCFWFQHPVDFLSDNFILAAATNPAAVCGHLSTQPFTTSFSIGF